MGKEYETNTCAYFNNLKKSLANLYIQRRNFNIFNYYSGTQPTFTMKGHSSLLIPLRKGQKKGIKKHLKLKI